MSKLLDSSRTACSSNPKSMCFRTKESDYDQFIFAIRFTILILTCIYNILAILFDDHYPLWLGITLFIAIITYFYMLYYHNNDYLACIAVQVIIVIYTYGLTTDPANFFVMPVAALCCFVLYSLQFYPLIMMVSYIGIAFLLLNRHQIQAKEIMGGDEQIAKYLSLARDDWLIAAFTIFLTMGVYQYFNAKIWKEYISTKKELIKKNQELLQANKKMEEMLIDLTETNQRLESTNSSLAEAMKSQDLFVACVSHELRTPLNAMLGNIELLLLEQFDINKKKMLKTCQLCGEVLLVLINNILDVAKINAASLEINLSVMNMQQLIEKIWTISRPKILQKELYGKLVISKNVPLWLKGDYYRLMQIVINLVSNATKFTTNGGVKVLISWEENKTNTNFSQEDFFQTAADVLDPCLNLGTIPNEYNNTRKINEVFRLPDRSSSMTRLKQEQWIMYSENDDDLSIIEAKLPIQMKKTGTLIIQVIDTGCGISHQSQKKIFEPFVQADSSITRKYGGTGLGLYIIKELLNKMNGMITVSSEPNKGAKFTIKIPLSTLSPEEAYNSKETLFPTCKLIPQSTTPPVLIVDDSHYNQNILKTYLDNMKIPSETADNGLDALNKIKSHPPGYYSLIMMDIQMPVMDGITASKRIRQHEKEVKCKDPVPIFIVTANCTATEQCECMSPNGEIKAAYFFRKPFGFSDCKMSVEAILAQKRIKRKVLVVDDDAFNRELLQVQIRKLGLECDVCGNGFTALKKLKEDPEIAVMMLDFEMPDLNGVEVARRVRQELNLKKIVIIGTTGNVEEHANQVSLLNGMNRVLTKPINLNQISVLFKELKLISY